MFACGIRTAVHCPALPPETGMAGPSWSIPRPSRSAHRASSRAPAGSHTKPCSSCCVALYGIAVACAMRAPPGAVALALERSMRSAPVPRQARVVDCETVDVPTPAQPSAPAAESSQPWRSAYAMVLVYPRGFLTDTRWWKSR
jgi:hypothetical protein